MINYEETFDNYPLRSLASEINNLYEDKNYEVLAIDHVLLLFYLEKPNISYIIHPFNNFEEYIVKNTFSSKYCLFPIYKVKLQ